MWYDNWKTSNPTDDGYGYDLVSNCCGAEIEQLDEKVSNCCSAKYYDDTAFCSDCKDGSVAIDKVCAECGYECDEIEDHEYEAIQKENYLEDRADEERHERLRG